MKPFRHRSSAPTVTTNESRSIPDPGVPTDSRVAACPYCGVALKKVPGAKTKCPDCGEYMFVRTDSRINSRVVVTEVQASDIDDEWAKINGTWDERLADRNRRDQTRERLREKWGIEPAERDVEWGALNAKIKECIQHANWQTYRDTMMEMAHQVREEWYRTSEAQRKPAKLRQALHMYLDVAYLDLNGPHDMHLHEKGEEHDMPAWDPSSVFLPIGEPVDYVRSLCETLDMSFEQCLGEYAPVAADQGSRYPLLWHVAKPMILHELTNDES